MLSEPGPTQGDIHFSLFGFPVRIHPMFWLTGLFLGLGLEDPKLVLLWILAMVPSILVHELGHALLMRRFGSRPHIVLYGLGGLAVPDGYRFAPRRGARVLISLAGPIAGFLLAAAVTLGCVAAQLPIAFGTIWGVPVVPFVLQLGYPAGFLSFLLEISVAWGLLNLLPIFPLDGGQVSEELFTGARSQDGLRQAIIVAIVTATAVAAYELLQIVKGTAAALGLFTVVLFGYLAYLNYMRLQMHGGGPRW